MGLARDGLNIIVSAIIFFLTISYPQAVPQVPPNQACTSPTPDKNPLSGPCA